MRERGVAAAHQVEQRDGDVRLDAVTRIVAFDRRTARTGDALQGVVLDRSVPKFHLDDEVAAKRCGSARLAFPARSPSAVDDGHPAEPVRFFHVVGRSDRPSHRTVAEDRILM
jgi:hypothetical protein